MVDTLNVLFNNTHIARQNADDAAIDENILDKQAWCEPFVYDNKSASEAFYEEFPEHRD